MKETFVKELVKIDLKNPILMGGLPGLGLVGKIAIRSLIKHFKAQKFAHIYSPHFPYLVLVNKKGSVRLTRGTFYFWKNKKGSNDFIFFTGDSQAQTNKGQYEITACILDFAKRYHVNLILTIGGYRTEIMGKPGVIAAATNLELLNRALQVKAKATPLGIPIVGTAGLILGLARFEKIAALCLLGETCGYLPDPKAAKSVLEVVQALLDIDVDLTVLDEEIVKSEKMVRHLKKVEEKRAYQAEDTRKEEKKKITYIS